MWISLLRGFKLMCIRILYLVCAVALHHLILIDFIIDINQAVCFTEELYHYFNINKDFRLILSKVSVCGVVVLELGTEMGYEFFVTRVTGEDSEMEVLGFPEKLLMVGL